jgi:hypothetical protein
MTSNERKLLIGGVALGAAVALAAMQVRSFILRPGDATPAAAETSTGEPATEGATTVELSGAEQRSIGVQTVEVRPQTIRRKIQTTGRVRAAESRSCL